MKVLPITDRIGIAVESDLEELPTPTVSISTAVEPTPGSDIPLTSQRAIQNMRGLLNWTPEMAEDVRLKFKEYLDWLERNLHDL